MHEDWEQKSVRELPEGINEKDRKVASALHACIPQIEKPVIPPTFGMPDTCIIGIMAGGEQALKHPVETASISSNPDSPLSNVAEILNMISKCRLTNYILIKQKQNNCYKNRVLLKRYLTPTKQIIVSLKTTEV